MLSHTLARVWKRAQPITGPYKDAATIAVLIEKEQAFLVLPQRHARMVERVIGRRVGTGGSARVDCLEA